MSTSSRRPSRATTTHAVKSASREAAGIPDPSWARHCYAAAQAEAIAESAASAKADDEDVVDAEVIDEDEDEKK